VLVTHGATIEALTGINPGTAEMVIVTPRGGGAFAVAGRLGIRQASMRRVMELAERSCYNPPSSSRRPVDHRRQS
jgi:hypothetical protein